MSTNTPNPRQQMLESLPEAQRNHIEALRQEAVKAMELRGYQCTSQEMDEATFACGDFTTKVRVFPKSELYSLIFSPLSPEDTSIDNPSTAIDTADLIRIVESQSVVDGKMKDARLKLYEATEKGSSSVA
jgi:hypothetical protein